MTSDDSLFEEAKSDKDTRKAVQNQIADIKNFVKGINIDEFKNGEWFAKLLTFSLDKYVQKVNADYFRGKYPNLPPDAIVQARIKLAAKYAGIEGSLTAAAYSTAVIATLGSAGGASPVTGPAGLTAFGVDLVYASQLQLRLAYDIAVLYGVPLDLDDPEDLWKLIRIAFAIQVGEDAGNASKRGPGCGPTSGKSDFFRSQTRRSQEPSGYRQVFIAAQYHQNFNSGGEHTAVYGCELLDDEGNGK